MIMMVVVVVVVVVIIIIIIIMMQYALFEDCHEIQQAAVMTQYTACRIRDVNN
jgi:hypothetical protein